jgi:hypothetical protein
MMIRIYDLMGKNEIQTYEYSKNLLELQKSKDKKLNEFNLSKDFGDLKLTKNYYKLLLQKNELITNLIFK